LKEPAHFFLSLAGKKKELKINLVKPPDMNSIKVGDKIPSFSLSDQDGVLVNEGLLTGNKKMIIFFYPKDDSPGCTKEACYFRDLYKACR
jgi:peroxiredoxin